MKRNWPIIGLTALVVLIVALLVVHLHASSKRAVLSWFRENQALNAHHFADEIESFFQGHSQELLALSSLMPSQGDGLSWMKNRIETHSRDAKKDYTTEISLCNADGRVTYSTHADEVGLDYGKSDFFAWAKKEGKKGEIFVSPQPTVGPFPLFFLSIPLFQGSTKSKSSNRAEEFAGVISLQVDLKDFLLSKLEEASLDLHQMWIIDKAGTILFHSEHPEMTLRNIHQIDKSCKECHVSFDYAERILKERRGVVDYRLRDMPKKLAAFSTIQFGNASWVVVVNYPYNEAAAFATKNLREHLILLAIVVLAFVVSSALILRNNGLKTRAEEESRHWQEKIAERKKAEEALHLERNKLKGVLDNMQDGVAIVSRQCDIQYINPVIEKEFGPINGRKCHEYFHDLLEVCAWCKGKDVFAGNPAQWEWYSPKNGKTYEIFEAPMISAEGIDSKLEILHDITERRRTEVALRELEMQRRHLSFKLLTAQETERRRISRELHDELGGALAVFKLRVSRIEKNLSTAQTELKEECRSNLQYIDQVIDDVHRLSRDLSPSILEDLGLSAALQWLIDNFGKNFSINMMADITEIDHLFPQNTQIVIYRIVQEALTNIGKHAQAKNVSLVIKRNDGTISLSLEDDGKGFDVRKAMMKDAGERGIGLASMDERARMLGGSLELWSEEGKGTQVTLSIPLEKKESV